jgi:VWFA-related protein
MTPRKRNFSRVLAVAVLTCSIFIPARSKDKEDLSQVKFTARTELVLIPAIVTDRSGNHITGLKKEDFAVQEGRTEQQIVTFEEIRTDQHPIARPAHTNEFSNYVAEQPSTSRITVILLDLINTPFTAQAAGRQELLKYLTQSVDTREPTALYTLTRDGLKVIHDFTTNPRVLVAALHKAKGDPYEMVDSPEEAEAITGSASPEGSSGDSSSPASGSTPTHSTSESAVQAGVAAEATKIQAMLEDAELNLQSFQQRLAITYTLDAMRQIAQALAGYSGRKSLIWASGGFPFNVSDNSMQLVPSERDSLSDVWPLYEHTWQLLNDAQISLYPVDVKGLQVVTIPGASIQSAGRNGGRTFGQHSSTKQMDRQTSLQTFARMTGGRAYYNSNDLVKGFRDAVSDSSQYYMLGYYLAHSDTKPGWRRLTVRVNRDHMEVRAREGFFVTNATVDPLDSRKADISSALLSPLDNTSLALLVRWGKIEKRKDSDPRLVNYEIHFSPQSDVINTLDNNHVSLDVVTLALTPEGKRASDPDAQKVDVHLTPEHAEGIRKQGLVFREVLNLAPGVYTVRFVVRDDFTGRTGSVAAPLTLE